jgi:predicted porin
MNKGVVALCAFCALPVPALAQVTVFGLIDLRVSRISNEGAGAVKGLNPSGIGPSRWGLRGVEDLGDGAYAGFHLESQIQPDVGTSNANKFWNRRSTVHLGSRKWGELRLGRDVTPSYRITTQFDPFTANGIAADINLVSAGPNANNRPAALRINSYNQADNAIGYFLPGSDGDSSTGSVYGQVMLAPGEGGTGDRYAGIHLGWKGRNLEVAGHTARNDPATGSAILRYKTSGVAASYAFMTGTTVMAQYQVERSERASGIEYEEKWWLLGAVHRVGAGEIRASYGHRNATGNAAESRNDATLQALGYVHHLSKRTALYTTYARLDNAGTGTYLLPNGPTSIAPGGASTGFEFGIRHRF